MGSAFTGGTPDFPVSHGGIAGFLKTVALEMPTVACRTIHLDRNESDTHLLECLLSEIGFVEGPVECAYGHQRRVTMLPRLEPPQERGRTEQPTWGQIPFFW